MKRFNIMGQDWNDNTHPDNVHQDGENNDKFDFLHVYPTF